MEYPTGGEVKRARPGPFCTACFEVAETIGDSFCLAFVYRPTCSYSYRMCILISPVVVQCQ